MKLSRFWLCSSIVVALAACSAPGTQVPDAALKSEGQTASTVSVRNVASTPLSVTAGGMIIYNKTAVAFELKADATGYDAGTGTLTLSDFFRKVYLKGTVTGVYCDGYKVIVTGTLYGSATGTFSCEVAALGGPGKDTFSVTTSGGYNVYGTLTTGSVKTYGVCPTPYPTATPTYVPTYEPTYEPTYKPTEEPTYKPTTEPTTPPDCGPFTTFTQGGWGSPPNGNNPGAFLAENFDDLTGGTLVIGQGNTITFTSAEAVEAFLPAGGPPGVLTEDLTNPTTTPAGVLAGQLTALELNLLNNPDLDDVVINTGEFAGMTIGEFHLLAEQILGGAPLPAGVTLAEVNEQATQINEFFNDNDGVDPDGVIFSCPD